MKVCSPYFDPEFDSLSERIYGPNCKVCIDNDSLEDCTVVKVDSIKRQGLLLEVVQVLMDMNLIISKSYISFDAGWFMDVFHVKDEHGNKLTDQRVINYIQQAICSSRKAPKTSGTTKASCANNVLECGELSEHTAIEMTGTDRPGLFSEIWAALADLHCNIVEAHAWSHNARLACVAYISDQSTHSPIEDPNRLAIIEDHLTTVFRSTTTSAPYMTSQLQEVKTDYLSGGEGAMTTSVERRLHQLMLSVRDFDWPADDHRGKSTIVSIESCDWKGYSIVSVKSKDRPRLMFDTVCTLTDMQYIVFHASVASHEGYASQEYFIRHVDGCALNTESEKERVIKCLEAAIERRVCEGVRVELRAENRVGLLSDITRVLRENGLAVVRADVATEGDKSVNAFYVRDISGNDVDMEFVESMKREMGPVYLSVKNETRARQHSTNHHQTSRFSITNLFKSRFSHNFIQIK